MIGYNQSHICKRDWLFNSQMFSDLSKVIGQLYIIPFFKVPDQSCTITSLKKED